MRRFLLGQSISWEAADRALSGSRVRCCLQAGCRTQTGADLGERICNAFREVLASTSAAEEAGSAAACPGAIIIGTDAPDLRSHHLRAAEEALRAHAVRPSAPALFARGSGFPVDSAPLMVHPLSCGQAVVGPARDGGFWLLGLSQPPEQSVLKVRRHCRFQRPAALTPDLTTHAALTQCCCAEHRLEHREDPRAAPAKPARSGDRGGSGQAAHARGHRYRR